MEMSIQELADQYYTAQQLRLAKDRESAKLKETETELKARLIELMLAEKLTSIGGQSCTVRYHRKDKPRPDDWTKIWGYIQMTGDFDLLQHRLTEEAVKARWEAGIEVPGIVHYPLDDLTVSPIK